MARTLAIAAYQNLSEKQFLQNDQIDMRNNNRFTVFSCRLWQNRGEKGCDS